MGDGTWGLKESDMTELTEHTCTLGKVGAKGERRLRE